MINKLILFHWDQCGHCQAFKPTWKEIVDWVNQNKQKYNLETRDYEANRDKSIIDKYNIVAFPTIKLFMNNKIIDINSQDKNKIIDFIKKTIKNSGVQTRNNSSYENKIQLSQYQVYENNKKIEDRFKGQQVKCVDGVCKRYNIKSTGEKQIMRGGNAIIEPYDPNLNYYQKYAKYKNKYLNVVGYNY